MSAIARRSGYVLLAACLLAGGVVLGSLAAFWPGDTAADAQAGPAVAVGDTGPESVEAISAAPEPGAPRSWQSGLQMATYSVVNLQNGNGLTVIPVVSWSGVGPTLDMTLYHNSATVTEDQALLTRGMGFDIGPGWTTSYSGHVYVDPLDSAVATVFEDDGTRNVFNKVGADWVAPAGVLDVVGQSTGSGHSEV